MAATTLDDVITELDNVIAEARREKSRLGYFAILYRNVTRRVRDGVREGRFQDGARMELLDVNFANRYLHAFNRYKRGEPPSRCWATAFEAGTRRRPLVLQHLLLGINAHINFDLGAAAAITSPGGKVTDLQHDFNEINLLLGEMLDDVQDRLSSVSPWMWIMDKVGGRTDEALCTFCLNASRDIAWKWAERLAPLPPEQIDREMEELDDVVDKLAHTIRNPGFLINCAALVIWIAEKRDVGLVMDALE
jgi:hypothetical protein